MEEEFANYKIAKDLKDLGFVKTCFGFFESTTSIIHPFITKNEGGAVAAPLWQQVVDWLLLKYDLVVYTEPRGPMVPNGIGWAGKIKTLDQLEVIYDSWETGYYETSREALEDALECAIKKIKSNLI